MPLPVARARIDYAFVPVSAPSSGTDRFPFIGGKKADSTERDCFEANFNPARKTSNDNATCAERNRRALLPAIIWLTRAVKVVPPLLPSASTMTALASPGAGLLRRHAENLHGQFRREDAFASFCTDALLRLLRGRHSPVLFANQSDTGRISRSYAD